MSDKPASKFDAKQFLFPMLKESEAFTSIDVVESWIEDGGDLSHLPIQPLYLVLKNLPAQQTSKYLTSFTKDQRKTFLDLDLWDKDNLDVEEFQYWVNAYGRCEDDNIRYEFARSSEFGLFLKGKFHIQTFDVEDPQYPDHDNYFLTEDNLLLIEFDDEYPYLDEVRQLVKDLYTELGVENAYTFIFKLISDGYFSFLEDEYQLKKGRLANLGFVDFYDALEIDNAFPKKELLDNWIKKKEKFKVGIDAQAKKQILHKSALAPFEDKLNSFDIELGKVSDAKRKEYLQFNFVRLVNGNISLKGSMKGGAMALSRVGGVVRSHLQLGFDYLRENQTWVSEPQESLFDYFDFTEIFKIGNSLIKFTQKEVKKSIRTYELEDNDSFLGQYWNTFLDNLLDEHPKFEGFVLSKPKEINNLELYNEFYNHYLCFISLCPFINQMYKVFFQLKEEGQLQDSFYLNYSVEQIDFESIILSSFANFLIGSFENANGKKMGLTLNEFKSFAKMVTEDGSVKDYSEIEDDLLKFAKQFGMEAVHHFSKYVFFLLKDQLDGYDFSSLEEKDFSHVGGPIIFNIH